MGVLSLPSSVSKAESNCCFLKDTSEKTLSCSYVEGPSLSNLFPCFAGAPIFIGSPPNEIYGQNVKKWWKNYFNETITAPDIEIGALSLGACTSSCITPNVYKWEIDLDTSKEIAVGQNVDFNVKVSFTDAFSNIVSALSNLPQSSVNILNIQCVNCNGAVTSVMSTTTTNGKLNETVKYSFDTVAYSKLNIGLELKPVFNFSIDNGLWKGIYTFNLKLNNINCSQFTNTDSCNPTMCLWASKINGPSGNSGKCVTKQEVGVCTSLTSGECSKSEVCALDKNNNCGVKQVIDNNNAVDKVIADEHPIPTKSLLPDCAFTGSCRDANDLVALGLKIVNYVFSIVAGLAFVMFIYGGFTWIFSFGSSDKIKKGQQIFVYAIIGLVIVFSAYILVGFLLEVLNVSDTFRGIT